jgi:hypothetical protein
MRQTRIEFFGDPDFDQIASTPTASFIQLTNHPDGKSIFTLSVPARPHGGLDVKMFNKFSIIEFLSNSLGSYNSIPLSKRRPKA